MRSFERFVVNFATCREIRSLDAEIQTYKLQTLIPQIFPKKYENLNMEMISYQGAYIRTLALIFVEEMIIRHKKYIMEGQPLTTSVILFTEAIE